MILTSRTRLILTGAQFGENHYPAASPVRGETMSHSYDTGRQAMAELGSKQPHELLLMLGGVLAVLLTVARYGIQYVTTGIPQNQYTAVTTALIINVVLGGALWASSAITRKNLMNGAIVAGVISIILIYYGGQPGTIGGLIGILGAIVAAAKPYLPWSRRSEWTAEIGRVSCWEGGELSIDGPFLRRTLFLTEARR